MKINIISIGHKMPAWLQAGFNEYQKRFPKECPLHLIEIAPKKPDAKNVLKDYIKKIPDQNEIEFLNQSVSDGGFLQSQIWRKFQEKYGRKTNIGI